MSYASLIFTTLLMSLNVSAATPNCYRISAQELKSTLVKAEQVCFRESDWQISSRDCLSLTACPLIQNLESRRQKINYAIGKVGNPNYSLCHQIGGVPHQMEIKGSKGFEPVSICALGNQSFLDLNRLAKAYFKQH